MASSNDSLQLHLAVKAGDEEKVKELLSKSKETGLHNIDEEDPNGFTPLIEACVAGNESLVKLLLNSGCSAQPPSGSRHTPLRGACVSGQAHLIPVLIEAGADVNGVSDGHRTPLMGACFLRPNASVEKSVLCTKALLTDPRTDPTIRNSFGETAMDLAKIRGYEESITLIKEALEQAKWLPSNFVVAGRPYWSNDNDCPQKPVPTRDDEDCFLFADFPDFRPSLSPEQVLKAGAFGGTYFRSISSKTAGKTFKVGSHLEFPQDWFEGMNVEKMVTSASYRKEVNKYGVKSGNDLEFWERKGWMRKQDPYGWFQWYCRFFLGRRTEDDERQVSRWIKAIGTKGRWRTFLVGHCVKANKEWDDFAVSPVTRQTLLHWGYELTKAHFDLLAPPIRNGKSVIYMGVVADERSKSDTNIECQSKRQKLE